MPNLSLYLVIGQVFVLLARMLHLLDGDRLWFAAGHFFVGEWWRVFTFMFLTPIPQSAFGYMAMVFGWYLFYLMGSALEGYWGVFRFNVYLFSSYALTVALSFLTPTDPVTNYYILGSVFLAFAFLNPDFELLLFFILPLKIKWLALITWVLYAFTFVRGAWSTRLQIIGSVVTFVLFFAGHLFRGAKQAGRATAQRAARAKDESEPRHVCHVCGKTDVTNPEMDFRYCSKCAGDQCYCPEHIQNHAHVVAPESKE